MLHPVVERELRVALHKRDRMKARLQIAAVAAAICGFCFLVSLADLTAWGRRLHPFLFCFGLYLAVIRPAQSTIGLFAEERRTQSLELLYLTGMTSTELFAGKLLGGVLVAADDLLGLMPFLALPFLSGGVSLNLFLATLACLPTLLLFTVALAVLASVLCSDDSSAMVLMFVLGGVLCLATTLPYIFGTVLTGSAPFSETWLALSPAYPPYLVGTGSNARSIPQFWPALTMMWIWTILCIAGASFVLNRNWRSDPDAQLFSRWRKQLNDWIRGSAELRSSVRQQLLTTPLTAKELVDGQIEVVRRQFQPLRRFLLGLYVVMILIGFLTRDWTVAAIFSYLLIWGIYFLWALRNPRNSLAFVMWVALNTGRPVFALPRSRRMGWQWIWILFNIRSIGRVFGGVAQFPTGSSGELIMIGFLCIIILVMAANWYSERAMMRDQLITDLRSIAQEPVPDPEDPRLKGWDMEQRLPSRGY